MWQDKCSFLSIDFSAIVCCVGGLGFYARLTCRILFLSSEFVFQTRMWSNSGSHFDGFATIVSHHCMHLQMLWSRLIEPPNIVESNQMTLMLNRLAKGEALCSLFWNNYDYHLGTSQFISWASVFDLRSSTLDILFH